MITIPKAPAWLVVQDQGWRGQRAIGLPPGGAMDRHALAMANLLVGNPVSAAGLEWALGPGVVRFERRCLVALAGAAPTATLGGRPAPLLTTLVAEAGEELVVSAITGGRFSYLALGGGVDVPEVLGSRSTYLRGGFGGSHGRRIRNGDYLPLGPPAGLAPAAGFAVPDALLGDATDAAIRIMPGPQAGGFDAEAKELLAAVPWIVGTASDRMGYRLEGPALRHAGPASQASEGACPGALQVPGDGGPIVLMADGPTVGGYPKLGVVCEGDLARLAQRQPGEPVRFRWVTTAEGQKLLRLRAIQLHTLASLVTASPGA